MRDEATNRFSETVQTTVQVCRDLGIAVSKPLTANHPVLVMRTVLTMRKNVAADTEGRRFL